MLLFIHSFMRKLFILLSAILSLFISFSFAAPNTLDSSYSIEWNETEYTLPSEHSAATDNQSTQKDNPTITRTVITAVPKTGPSFSLIWISLATLAIFGGYIYIKKRADI